MILPLLQPLNIFSVEDEIHFLLACSLFSDDCQSFLENIHRNFPSTASLNDLNMYLWLMRQEDQPNVWGISVKSLWKKDSNFQVTQVEFTTLVVL